MSTTPDWQALAEKTFGMSKDIIKASNEWLTLNPDWSGEIFFMNYPPRFVGIFHLYGVNSLSDSRLLEIGKLATLLCTKYGLIGKKHYQANTIEYKFHLPIK